MRDMIFRKSALFALPLAAIWSATTLAGCGPQGGGGDASPSAGQAGDDALISAQAQSAITTDPKLDGAEITADVKAGVATLTGTVPTAAGKALAEADAKGTQGVKSVVDRLTVKK